MLKGRKVYTNNDWKNALGGGYYNYCTKYHLSKYTTTTTTATLLHPFNSFFTQDNLGKPVPER